MEQAARRSPKRPLDAASAAGDKRRRVQDVALAAADSETPKSPPAAPQSPRKGAQAAEQHVTSFLHSCERWQRRLGALTGALDAKVQAAETQQVGAALGDLVTRVELRALRGDARAARARLQWAQWLQEDAAACARQLRLARQDAELFEAMEKQLVDDRVVELETQLAQKRAVEREKEVELSSLRADQAQLLQASHVLPNAEFDTLVAEKKQMQDDMREMQEQIKQQKRELERAKEQCDRLEKDNATLAKEAKQLRQKQETHELETAKQNTAQDEEIKALQTELQAAKKREEKMAALLKAADKEIVKGKQRKEELKILYAKFSSTMDSVSEKTMRLEELEQELKDMTSNLHEIQTQKEELEKQVTQLQQEKKDMLATQLREKDNVTEELAKVQNQYAELKELESQQKELAGRMQSEIEELKAQNESLREQQVKKEHQSVGQPSTEGEKRGADTTNTLVVQVAEKEALQMFVQRYYAAAEEKCSNLLHKVSELESQKASIQEQTKESCGILRMCTQIDSCDESVRASLLDVMATLEGLT